MGFQPRINIHADDYGMVSQSNQRIQACWENGCINGVSVMVNGSQPALAGECPAIPAALHLNLVEGRPLTPSDQVPLLVRPDGMFAHSFFGLLLLSFSGKRKELERQLYLEIEAQLMAFQRLYPALEELSVDSHQHTHMIPLVFHTLLRVIRDRNIRVGYLRVPAEPIVPFLLEPSLYPTYRPVNLLKNIVLNILWQFNRRAFRESGISTAIFCGIIFSGEMDEGRLKKVFPHFCRLASRREQDLEFLFHPGAILPGEPFLDPDKAGFCQFYLSPGRQTDADTVCSESWQDLLRSVSEKEEGCAFAVLE
ncbi:MAG: ChbG/HpnK family deacetylase [Eubacteriales bacterium]|nr:ChbG/HpnK family deacetylase [Eubacteriales bacterium]